MQILRRLSNPNKGCPGLGETGTVSELLRIVPVARIPPWFLSDNHFRADHWGSRPGFCIKISMTGTDNNLFEESYRVVAVEPERLIIKGIMTGTVLTIVNSDPGTPLTAEEYPLGKLIVLSDPSASAPN